MAFERCLVGCVCGSFGSSSVWCTSHASRGPLQVQCEDCDSVTRKEALTCVTARREVRCGPCATVCDSVLCTIVLAVDHAPTTLRTACALGHFRRDGQPCRA
eukprot:1745877-Prymnesium_polylepis.2